MIDPFEALDKIKGRAPRLCFTGSREASMKMILYAQKAVRRAIDKGWWIVAGDAKGIDRAVCLEAWLYAREKEMSFTPLVVYGVEDLPRNGWWGECYVKADVDQNDGERWKRRDEVMVNDADAVLGCWNSVSPGTAYTMWYAEHKAGKPVLCAKFEMPTAEELRESRTVDLMTPTEKEERRKYKKVYR